MSTRSFIDELRITVATMQAMKPDKADAIGRAHALIVDGFLVDNGDGTGTVLSSNLSTRYSVNGACACAAAAQGKRCKHLEAWDLYKLVQKRLAAQLAPEVLKDQASREPSMAEDTAELVRIPPQYIQLIQGKPFVRYFGLLAMAHAQGLQKLQASFTYNDAELSLAKAVAVFADGRWFEEAADSTAANAPRIGLHWRRMSLTRAKARVLRDALNIGICSVEEMD